MQIQKSLKVPIHYDATKIKLDKLNKLTSRITYCIRLISGLITEEITITVDRPTIRNLVKDNEIAAKTGLSAGFIDQCIDKVIWAWNSYRRLHREWEKKIKSAEERVQSARDEKEKEKRGKSLKKLLKKEPSKPSFQDKISCRFDYRTGRVERGNGKFTPLWIHISTLEKGRTIDIPLNPSQYHLNQLKLKNAEIDIDDFEIIKFNKKYYAHISITKMVEDKPISSIGGIDQGLNRTIAVVLLTNPIPREELLLDAAKRELLDKYDAIITSLQQTEKWDKLRELRHKRENVAIYHDWCLANQVADYTQGSLIAIGNSRFRQTQFRGNGMPTLRKRIGKWSYGRQRKFITLKRAERGYPTELKDEYKTSRECHICHSLLTTRKWSNGYSYTLCHSCGAKGDADLNAAYNIAFRCRDDRLKGQMNMVKNHASA